MKTRKKHAKIFSFALNCKIKKKNRQLFHFETMKLGFYASKYIQKTFGYRSALLNKIWYTRYSDPYQRPDYCMCSEFEKYIFVKIDVRYIYYIRPHSTIPYRCRLTYSIYLQHHRALLFLVSHNSVYIYTPYRLTTRVVVVYVHLLRCKKRRARRAKEAGR